MRWLLLVLATVAALAWWTRPAPLAQRTAPPPAPIATTNGPVEAHGVQVAEFAYSKPTPVPAVPPAGLYFELEGDQLRLVNRTGGEYMVPACDGNIRIALEALRPDGQWGVIERIPRECCPNSFHTYSLPDCHALQWTVRRYSGPHATRLRYRLLDQASYEFEGSIHLDQFEQL